MWHARLLSVGTGMPTVGIVHKLPLFGVTGFAGFFTLFCVTEGVTLTFEFDILFEFDFVTMVFSFKSMVAYLCIFSIPM